MEPSLRRRAGILTGFFCVVFFALLARLYCLQVLSHEELSAKRAAQTTARRTLSLPRAPILDDRDQILAVSVPVESAWVNPSLIADKPAAAARLAAALGLREADVLQSLGRQEMKFVWLKRWVSEAESARVRELAKEAPFKPERRSPEPRIGLITEYRRQYPHGALFSHGLGFESQDPGHHEGLERILDEFLSRVDRSYPVHVDGRRRQVGAADVALGGVEAILTLDLLLQKVVEEELDVACAEFRPKWATAVVMDPRTGAILALANRPNFDPNHPAGSPADSRLNRAVAAPYEPGSTLKPFLAATALDLGLLRPDSRIDCEMGLWKHGPRLLHDHHPYGTITLADVIKFSSNIGAAKIGAITLGRNRLYDAMQAWGFGARTGVDLASEDDGRLFPLPRWTVYSDTSVPMGHEIAVTPIQLVAAMSALANGGTLLRPFAVRRIVATDGTVLVEHGRQEVRRVVSPKTSKQMIEILRGVVDEGTGKKAQVAGIGVGGKTGTTQKIDPATRKYTHEKYISSFVGFAPTEDPKLCIAVILDEPQGAYYGGTVAAPVVGKIIQRGLVYVK